MILDTNAVSALLVGDPALEEVLKANERHHLPVIVIGEYRYGLLASRHRVRLQRLLETLIRESIVLPIDEATAEAYAQVRGELRRRGQQIPENDIWIAALAQQHSQAVASRDTHFDQVPGLRRIAW
ncbi:MAG: type II toxin-antitoxin system VapC family toxin [Thermoanaerobaculia bacterium]